MKGMDASGMLSLIEQLPAMMEKGWDAADATNIPEAGKISCLVISGMGGSAISGDIAATVLRDAADYPVIVNRNYGCPKFVGPSTLFIAISYSGNTEETISSFKEALRRKTPMIAISSGGQIKELSEKNNVPFIEIPTGLPPRAALGYILSSLLNVIYRSGLHDGLKDDFTAALALIKKLQKKYGPSVNFRENEVKQAAARLSGKIPVLLACDGTTYAAALRWKTQMNENSKMTALLSVFPELSHNDMVNFAQLKPGEHVLSFVLLRDEADAERMKKRIEITKSLLSGHVGGISEIWSQGKSMLERLMSLVIYGDYLSVYLAFLGGIDPTPVEIIDKLKKELGR